MIAGQGHVAEVAPAPHGIRLRPSLIYTYQVADGLTEVLIYAMILFGPWAFGTTEPWSIWTMNAAGYVLGCLLLHKVALRKLYVCRPQRWEDGRRKTRSVNPVAAATALRRLRSGLGLVTILILAYCLTSAVNSRATFHPEQLSFDYGHPVGWLPHSFDSRGTWLAFWTGLGLVCAFWSIDDWLGGKSTGEQVFQWQGSDLHTADFAAPIPARLRRLLWVLVLNGGVLALECIVQRVANSPKLLFIVVPHIHHTAETQFGPYAYRANAAQYFNLLWPVAVGSWWTLNRAASARGGVQHCLLVCGALMAACPVISTSRGGAFIALGLAAGVVICLAIMAGLGDRRRTPRRGLAFVGLLLFLTLAFVLGFGLGWKALKPRVASIEEGFASREEIHQVAGQMARDHPLFGIGPGAYESVSELYRPRTEHFWPAQVHNDWLEFRVTFGWAGSGLLIGALILVVLRWFVRGGIHGGRRFVFLVWLALGGCIIHARYDFPLQVHSILFPFVVLCAILFAVSRRAA